MSVRWLAAGLTLLLATFAVACEGDEDRDLPGGTARPSVTTTATPAATPPRTATQAPTSSATPGPDTPVTSTPTPPIENPPLPTAPSGTSTPSAPAPAPTITVPGNRHEELAPIEDVDVLVLESFPPQYVARLTSGLPSGCAEYSRTVVQRAGDLVRLTVYNTMPSDPMVACTMIYGMVTHNTPLGSDFVTGRTYTIEVNGKVEHTFVAQ